jgi:hypothetical protein
MEQGAQQHSSSSLSLRLERQTSKDVCSGYLRTEPGKKSDSEIGMV